MQAPTRPRLLPEGPPARLARLVLHRVEGPVDEAAWLPSLPPHEELRRRLPTWAAGLFLQAVDRDGADGWWGPIDPSTARLIPAVAARLPELGEVPVGRLVEQLRIGWRHGFTGLGACALAAVELAAWDLAGCRSGRSVAGLLGVPPDAVLEAYATVFGIDPDYHSGDEIAAAVTRCGYRIQKWRLPEGPAGGAAGLARNLALVTALVAAAAPGQIAIECDRSWNLEYLHAFFDACPGPLAWIEEPLTPWEGIPATNLRLRHPIAGGEHAYTRQELLRLEGVTVRQPDVTFLAGLNDFAGSIADTHSAGLLCAIHGNGLAGAVCAAAAVGVRGVLIEHHLMLEPVRQGLVSTPTIPAGGRIAVGSAPGFGIRPSARSSVARLVDSLS